MEDTGNKKQELDVPNENHLKILGKKHTVIGTKNSVNRWDSTMVTAEERICIFSDHVKELAQKVS